MSEQLHRLNWIMRFWLGEFHILKLFHFSQLREGETQEDDIGLLIFHSVVDPSVKVQMPIAASSTKLVGNKTKT